MYARDAKADAAPSATYSGVVHRGSIPLYWCQPLEPVCCCLPSYMPDITITPLQAGTKAAPKAMLRHFEESVDAYGDSLATD